MNLLVLNAEFAVKRALTKVFREENGEVNIITTVILIGIAVILAGIFKDGVKEILQNLLDTIKSSSANAISES